MDTKWIPAMLLGSSLAVIAPASAQNIDGTKYDKGRSVTLQGCVADAEKPGTFVLTGLKEWPEAKSVMGKYGPRHYWFDEKSDELKPFVGQTVQLKGKITDVRESEVEREPGGWHNGTRVAIELPGRDVLTSPKKAGVPAVALPSRVDMKITLLKFQVDEVRFVMKSCLTPG